MSAIRTGDHVVWISPQFEGGSFFNGRSTGKPKVVGHIEFAGRVVKHSYGEKTGQHTFTVMLSTPEDMKGKKKLVKGRNLYPNLVEHKVDENSVDRVEK
jgi:hypothetical protein